MSRKNQSKKIEEVQNKQEKKKNYLQRDLMVFLVVSCIVVAGIIGTLYYNEQTGMLDNYIEGMEIDFLK